MIIIVIPKIKENTKRFSYQSSVNMAPAIAAIKAASKNIKKRKYPLLMIFLLSLLKNLLFLFQPDSILQNKHFVNSTTQNGFIQPFFVWSILSLKS